MLSLDHVGFVAREIAGLRSLWQQLGFAPTEVRPLMAGEPGSAQYRSLEQESCHVVLERGYVELSAVLTDSPTHHLAPWIARGAGLHILALGADDVEAVHERCARAGLPVSGIATASRRIEYGERHGDARFRWFMVQSAATPEGLVCFVRNETPELVHQGAVMRQPNGALDLCEVFVTCSNLSEAVDRWSRLLAAPPRESTAGSACWTLTRGAALRVSTPQALAHRHGLQDTRDLPSPGRLAGLRIRLRSLDETRRRLGAQPQLRWHEHERSLVVRAAAGHDAVLVLDSSG